MNRIALSLIVVLFLTIVPVRADLASHNGTVLSGGSGQVDVALFSINTPGGFLMGTAFHENAAHLLSYVYDDGEPPVFLAEFAVINETATPWKGFQLLLVGADIYGSNGGVYGGQLARANDPVTLGGIGPDDVSFTVPTGSITLESSSIVRDGNNAILNINFDDYVDPFEAFGLAFYINDVGQTDRAFLLGQTPVAIPAPGSAFLGFLGLGALVLSKRWSVVPSPVKA